MVLADEPKVVCNLVNCIATDDEADALVLSGGTGITPRDETFEALGRLYEKSIGGFGEAFRRIATDAMGPQAMFFRASAGVFNRCPIFSLPGNAEAALLGLRRLIVPTLGHAVEMAMGRETHTAGAGARRAERALASDVRGWHVAADDTSVPTR